MMEPMEKSDETDENISEQSETTVEDKKKNYEEIKLYGGRGEFLLWTVNYEELKKYREQFGQCSARSAREIRKAELEKHKAESPIVSSEKLQRKEDSKSEDFSNLLTRLTLSDNGHLKWDKQVIGVEQAKLILTDAVIMPLHFPHIFTGNRRPWDSVLLFGPPGTGKTKLALAIATCDNNCTFIHFSKRIEENESFDLRTLIADNFSTYTFSSALTIVFIDEIDLLLSSESTRRKIMELKQYMDGSRNNYGRIFILAAANEPWRLDDELLKSFQKKVYTPLPSVTERLEILKLCLENISHMMNEFDLKMLAEKTEGYSGGDISTLVQDALMQPIRKVQSATHFKKVCHPSHFDSDMLTPCSPGCPGAMEMSWEDIPEKKLLEPVISMSDMLHSLTRSKPSVEEYDLRQYKYFQERCSC